MKFRYPDTAVHTSDDWCIDEYVNRDLFRAASKEDAAEQSAEDIKALHKIVNDKEFLGISELTDYVVTDCPKLQAMLFDKYYAFKAYIDDKRAMHLLHSHYEKEIERLKKQVDYLSKELREDRELFKAFREEDAKLRHYVCQLDGGQAIIQILESGLDGTVKLDSDD